MLSVLDINLLHEIARKWPFDPHWITVSMRTRACSRAYYRPGAELGAEHGAEQHEQSSMSRAA